MIILFPIFGLAKESTFLKNDENMKSSYSIKKLDFTIECQGVDSSHKMIAWNWQGCFVNMVKKENEKREDDFWSVRKEVEKRRNPLKDFYNRDSDTIHPKTKNIVTLQKK